jgi:Undecaprenyl-phosphate galactose phosphotransferase WbaP
MESNATVARVSVSQKSLSSPFGVRRPFSTVATLLLSDSCAIVLALLIASLLRNVFLHSWQDPIWTTIFAALVLVLCGLMSSGLYPGATINPVEELQRSTLSITLGFFALWSATFLLRDLSDSRLVYVLGYLLTALFVPLARAVIRGAFASHGWWGCNAAIIGYGSTGRAIHKSLRKQPGFGLKPVLILDDDPEKLSDICPNIQSGPVSLCLELASQECISYGILCMPSVSREKLLEIVNRYEHCFGRLIIIPNLIGMTSLGISAREVGGVIGLEVTRSLLRPSARVAKRLLDIALTVLFAPFIALVIAVAALLVKLEDRGPAFYASPRIGQGGKIFRTWKLRSMMQDSDKVLQAYLAANPAEAESWRINQKVHHDPRVTRIGGMLRKTSIDELPQLWNVLIGDMSIVGPRPILETQIAMYGPDFEWYKQLRPGITGLWQISGRNHLSFADRVMLDKYVVQNWSVWLDLYILGCTANVVLNAEGAY